MRRRGFLSGLLATPVVAASGAIPADVSTAGNIPMVLPGAPSVGAIGIDTLEQVRNGFSDRIVNAIMENQKRILALKAAKNIGIVGDEYYPDMDPTITSAAMRSWSPAYKNLYEKQKRQSLEFKIKRLERRVSSYKQSLFLPKELLDELEHDI